MNAAAEDDEVELCASCGVAEGDDIKLKRCTACFLVRYCSVKCQREHRPQHKKECKKRAAELRDELLFKQPESSHVGDCPICCLPMPIELRKTVFMSCCSKFICRGCNYANQIRELEARRLPKCAFCRKVSPSTDEEITEHRMKRIEANDPNELCEIGKDKCDEGDCTAAFDYFTKAADLGDAEAHYRLSLMYYLGQGVATDGKKQRHHLTEAAIGGHPGARQNLACLEGQDGRYDRAAKHFIIGAKLGFDDSLESVKNLYKDGVVSKEDFTAALRGHKAAIEATKSPQREEADKIRASRRGF